MQKLVSLLIAIGMLSLTALSQIEARVRSAPANPFIDADRSFTFGEDAERDKQALATIERGLASDGGNYQWLWRAARALYYVGDNASQAEKLRYFERGMNTGQRAVEQQPNAVEGHFWLAANYGGYSEQKGVFKALQMIRKIRAEMEIALRLNDRYQDGGAYLALGEMDRQLPRVIGGNLGRAIARLEQGLSIAPANLEMKLALARAYHEAGRKDEARRQLQEIAGRQVNPSRARAERDVQEKARRLLAKI